MDGMTKREKQTDETAQIKHSVEVGRRGKCPCVCVREIERVRERERGREAGQIIVLPVHTNKTSLAVEC